MKKSVQRLNRVSGIVGSSNRKSSRHASVTARVSAELLEQRRLLTGVTGEVFLDPANTGVFNPASQTGLAGRVVYADLNGNGTLDAGEPSTTTDANGLYTLPVPTVAETIRTVSPAGWTTSTSAVVAQAGSSVTINLGEYPLMDITGTIYADENADGFQNNGEVGLAGVTVYQDVNNNGKFDAGEPFGISGSNGSYAVYGVVPTSLYTPVVNYQNLPGYISELPETSFAYLPGHNLNLTVGYASESYVVGNVALNLGSNSTTGFANQTVYADLNNDGILDAGDISAFTNSYGGFQFGGLPTGTYNMRVVVPTGYSIYPGTSAALQITVGTLTASNVYFELIQSAQATGTISGTVYTDVNQNGTLDSGDTGVSNGEVYLDLNNDGVLDSGDTIAYTSATGAYQFSGLTSGAYTVRDVVPSGSYLTQPGAGSYTATVTAGQTISNLNFGQAVSAGNGAVTGEVFIDLYDTGVINAQIDTGLAGRTVYADLNNNGQLDAGEPSTLTNALGDYTLNITAPAVIRTITPAGWAGTTAAVTVPATGATGLNFGQFQDMSLSGLIYADNNADSVRDVNEPGIPGVRVYLDLNRDGVYESGEPSALTDSNGVYSLTNLAPPGVGVQYNARIVTPAGYHPELSSYGWESYSGWNLIDTIGQAPQPFVQGYVDIQASNGGETSLAGITVYADLNNDGIFDTGDISAVTNIQGHFQFGGLPTGAVTINIVVPSGYTLVSGAASQTVNVTSVNYPYLSYELQTSTQPTGAISGTTFQDTNGNGTFDLSELPAAGRTVYLDTNNNGVLDPGEPSTVTDNAGQYLFAGLVPGTYTLRQVLPTGYVQTSPSNNNGLTATLTTFYGVTDRESFAGFGSEAVSGAITGTVYFDQNGNGLQDAGETGLAGRTVYIDLNNDGLIDPGDPTAVTDSSGKFSFTNLSPGTYVLRQQLAPGYQQTSPAAGSANSTTVTVGQTSAVLFGTDNPSPTAVISGSSTVAEGSSINLSAATSTEVGGQIASYSWDFNYNGTFISNTTGVSAVFSAAALDGPSTSKVALLVTDAAGNTNLTTESINITNVPPTAVFSGSTITQGAAGTAAFTNAYDPSVADTTAGFTYSYDFNDDGIYDLVTANPNATVPASYLTATGAHTIAGKITDKDGGFTAYTTTVQVNAPAGDPKLTGTFIGTAGSYKSLGNTGAKAFDGSLTTYFDGPNASGNWVGLDLGSAKIITSLAYASRSGWASRMNGGIFQASNSSTFASGVANLYTIASNANPSSTVLTTQKITNTAAYRYVRYLSPANSYGDVAEVQFFGHVGVVLTRLTGTTIGTTGSYQNDGLTISKATDGSLSTVFCGPVANGNWVGYDLGSSKTISQIQYAPSTGWASRLVGGQIQISTSANFTTGVTTIYTITATPVVGSLTVVNLASPVTARYIRYLSPNGSYGEIAEFQVFG